MPNQVDEIEQHNEERNKDGSYLLWDCFVNWALTLEKTEGRRNGKS